MQSFPLPSHKLNDHVHKGVSSLLDQNRCARENVQAWEQTREEGVPKLRQPSLGSRIRTLMSLRLLQGKEDTDWEKQPKIFTSPKDSLHHTGHLQK